MARPSKMMAYFTRELAARFGGCGTEIVMANGTWKPLTPKNGKRRSRNCVNVCKPETKTPCRPFAEVNNYCSTDGWTFFWRTTPSLLFGRQ